jgi:hypothetical protein
MSLLQCIRSVLPLGRDMWQIVTDLHANNFPHCNFDAQSIQQKYLKLANEQPGTVNPNMSRVTLLAKEIKEAINVKAGVSNPDLSDFFGEDGGVDEDDDTVVDGVVVEGGTGVAVGVGANIPSTLEVPPGNRRVSDLSSAGSMSTKKITRTNLLVSALEDSTSGTASAMTSIMQQRQLAEKAEWRYRRMEQEDERMRQEEERLELRRKREEAEEERRRERYGDRRRR